MDGCIDMSTEKIPRKHVTFHAWVDSNQFLHINFFRSNIKMAARVWKGSRSKNGALPLASNTAFALPHTCTGKPWVFHSIELKLNKLKPRALIQHTIFFFLVVRHGWFMHRLRWVKFVLVSGRRHNHLCYLSEHLDDRDVAKLVSNGQRRLTTLHQQTQHTSTT